MFGNRDAREQGDRAYYNMPDIDWSQVDPALVADLRQLGRVLTLATADLPAETEPTSPVQPTPGSSLPTPLQIAFRCFDVANRMWAETAAEEHDLRQVITTLRTALAVCWDLYSLREAESTTVAQLMTRLREQIEDFERDLQGLQVRTDRPGDLLQ